jgi:hypothetical protein
MLLTVLAGFVGLFAVAVLSPEVGSGESTSIPFAGSCPHAGVQSGSVLTSGLGSSRSETVVVAQGEGATLSGSLRDDGHGVSGATICVFARIISEEENQLLGTAATDQDGRYEFPLPPGPSRGLTAMYRTEQGQLNAATLLQTTATPVLRLGRGVVHNKHFAYFSGEIPGPDNDRVMVFLQVKIGHGWRVFRRYSTRNGGKFVMRYRFTRNFSPTTYVMRAQVMGGPDYPYLPGNSDTKALRVLP